MPTLNNQGLGLAVAFVPVFTVTGTVFINAGVAIQPGATITDTYTFTGAATTDIEFGISPRPQSTAYPQNMLSNGLQLSSLTITAANTVVATWTNTLNIPITPPISSTWTYAVFNSFFR